jgi:heavy metal efflux system protein
VPGAFNPQMEMNSAVRTLQIQVNRSELARYGLNVSDVGEMVESLIGGKRVSEMIIGQQRFGIAVRLPEIDEWMTRRPFIYSCLALMVALLCWLLVRE